MPDQTAKQCWQTHDHEKHTWYDDPKMWCPGVIAPPLDETRPIPSWADDQQSVDVVQRHIDKGWLIPEGENTEEQCERVTAHHSHDHGVHLHCPGVGAHHNTQIGKGGPHDPREHVWDKPIYCDDRGPRMGNEGNVFCRRPPNHEGLHMSALSDGHGDQRW